MVTRRTDARSRIGASSKKNPGRLVKEFRLTICLLST